MSKAIRQYGVFFIIPGMILGFSIILKLAAGPYWLATNFDPSYLYLADGLHILKHTVPNNTDHPGLPLMILCGVASWVFNIGRPVGEIAIHVFKDPEFYLHTVFVILSLFSFFTSLGLAVYVYRKTGDRLAALLSQLPAFSFLVLKSWETFEPVLPIVANINSEPLLISVITLFNFCILKSYFDSSSREELVSALFWGFVCALGTAEKLTFAPLLVVPLIILSWRNKVFFVGAFLVSFVLWTLPIIPKYPHFLGWIITLMTHSGDFGGKAGIIDISSFLMNWKSIILEHGVFIGFVFFALALVIRETVSKRWNKGTFFLLATAVGILFQFGVVAKHPAAHYLMPGLGLFSPLLVLIYLRVLSGSAGIRRIVISFIVLFSLAGSWQAMEYRSKLADLTKDILAFYNHIHEKYKGFTFLRYYRASGQDAALQFGDGWNGEYQFQNELSQVYPNSYFFNRGWTNRIVNFKDRVLSNDLLDNSAGIIFEGDYTYGDLTLEGTPFSVRLLEKGRLESIYILTQTTEKQALESFIAAVHFTQTEEFTKSLACAIQAKALHYQPEDDVDKFIRFITPYAQQSGQ